MTILHIVRSSAFNSHDLEQCLTLITQHDTLVLIDDGCYNVNHSSLHKALKSIPELSINVMLHHAQARAITIAESMFPITMNHLVDLTFTHESVITWQ